MSRRTVLLLLAFSACHPREDERASLRPRVASVPEVKDAAPPEVDRRLSSEAAVTVMGAEVLVAQGRIHDEASASLPGLLSEEYDRLRSAEARGDVSAKITRWAGPDDVLVLGPPPGAGTAVVFLHGYGGRFALECWQVARAVAADGATTACPNAGTDAAWTADANRRTVTRTIARLREAGATRIVLAGLSSGAVGATRIAPGLGPLAGLVLVAGADAAAPPPPCPVLLVYGTRDAMVSASSMAGYASRKGVRAVALAGGHFATLSHGPEVDATIATFVSGKAFAGQTPRVTAGR